MLRGNVGNISMRVRHSYSGSGWSVRTVGPEKAEPKKESRRLRPFAWVLGGAIIVSILGGVAVLSQRAPQPDRSESRSFSREEFGLSSPGIQTEATGSIEEPIVVSPIPAPVAPVETSAPATPLLPVPPPVEEAVHPLPAVPPISRAAESAGGRSGGAIVIAHALLPPAGSPSGSPSLEARGQDGIGGNSVEVVWGEVFADPPLLVGIVGMVRIGQNFQEMLVAPGSATIF
jgi:hypothetical protein